jgi:hypothetical protein
MSILRDAAAAAVALGLALVGFPACSTPHEAGQELGQAHAAAVRAETITAERLTEEVEAAKAGYDAPEDRRRFEAGYREAIAPVSDRVARLALEASAEDLGRRLGALGLAVGSAVGEAVREVEATARSLKDLDADAREELREAGRDVGRLVKGVGVALDAFAEGLEAELQRN